MATSIKPEQDPFSDEAWARVNASLRTDYEEEQNRTAPVRSFWQRLLHGVEGKSRLKEVGRSVVRGAAQFANETINTIGQALNAADEAVNPKGVRTREDFHIVPQSAIDQVYGKRSDDPIAAFTESATQFAVGFAATGPLGGAAGATTTAGKIALAAGRGAVVDAVAFDPDEAGLAELAARAPEGYGIRELGEALSVNGDDDELVKRMKRAAAGAIPGVALDALIAATRLGWAKAAARSGNASAERISKEAGETLAKIADGTHVPEGAHVVTLQDADGAWRLKPVQDSGEENISEGFKFSDRAEAEAQAESISFAMNERLSAAKQAGGLTQEQAEELRKAYRGFLSGAPIEEGTHFNFSYYSEPDEILSAIESVSKVFREELDAAQIREGVSIEEQAARLSEMIGGMGPEQAPGLMTAMLQRGSSVPQSVTFGAADIVLRDVAGKAGKLFDVVTARPHDVIAWEEARFAAGSLLRLQKALAGAHSEWGRTGRFMRERDTFAEAIERRAKPAKPSGDPSGTPRAKPLDDPAEAVQRMSQSAVLAVLKMAKMSGGQPSKLAGVAKAAHIIQETGFKRKALEFFINSALSSPVTHATALTMNAAVSTYEAATRMFTGAITGNKALRHEGWDLLVANERFLAENFATAMMAFRQGLSVINPQDVHTAIGGRIGNVVRIPSRGLLFADEFTRVTNYRSYIYAKSRRFWREKGLEGEGLSKAVANDLRNAFDPNTGAAIDPAGLKFAEVPTMSAALGSDTFGGKLTGFLNNAVEAKFIAPFVKTSINIFRYSFDRTPLLNMLAKRNREILKEGGEAAAVLHTQTALATAMGFYAYMKAKSGEITGQGPKQPGLRQLWLVDHKPYSVKINGEWISYRRLDPIFTPLSIMADVHDMVQELSDMGADGEATAEDVIAGSLSGIAASFANKSYMVGMTQFFEAWSGGKGDLAKRWLQGFGTTFATPQLLRAVNDDPYLREVQSFKDAIWNGVPGLSETLPARYNLFGEPVLRVHSFLPAPSRGSAEETVASDLLTLGRGFMPMARTRVLGVEVNLNDAAKFGRVDELTPYEYMQRELRTPTDGEQGLKEALTELVQSEDYREASAGSELYPGGERAIMAYRVIDAYRRRATAAMLEAFPLVQEEVELQREIKGRSVSEGDAGALDALREFGRQ